MAITLAHGGHVDARTISESQALDAFEGAGIKKGEALLGLQLLLLQVDWSFDSIYTLNGHG
jgi:hypothetical protein